MSPSTEQDYSAQIQELQDRGFLVLPDALTASQIEGSNRAIEAELQRNERDWVQFNRALT
jgi:hypothetical protein